MTNKNTPPNKLVVDFDGFDDSRINGLLVHLTNLINDFDANNRVISIDVVAYGKAIKYFTKGGDFLSGVVELQGRGVDFYTCSNAMKKFNVDSSELADGVRVTPSGVSHIVSLQMDGAAYFKA